MLAVANETKLDEMFKQSALVVDMFKKQGPAQKIPFKEDMWCIPIPHGQMGEFRVFRRENP
jgi:hypothetical protein